MIASTVSAVAAVAVLGGLVIGLLYLLAGALERHDPKPGRVSDAYLEQLRRNPRKGASS